MAIKMDRRNYRKHDNKNKELIKKSLIECGAGRSIVVDSEDEIIGGNGIYEQAKILQIPTRVIETDGSELVVVKRTDLKYDDEKRKKLAIMDNSTSDSSEFDIELLKDDFEDGFITELGVEELSSSFTNENGGGIESFMGGVFDDIGEIENNAFSNAVKEGSDQFSSTFVFNKEYEKEVLFFLKDKKEELSREIEQRALQYYEEQGEE